MGHPAHTRLLASRETERAALLTLRKIPAVEMISFADLPGETSRQE
jgi:hypothetical protein